MNQQANKKLSAVCQCGKVRFEAIGAPIASAACYCRSCQEAGRRFEQLAGAPAFRDSNGGTPMILFRKDRVQCMAGREYLQEHRLRPESPTRRVLATCCNSAMFADFTRGHWLSMFRSRFPAGLPPLEMRIMTSERRAGVELGDDVPNHGRLSGKLMWRLAAAWMAMGFRRVRLGF
jgi:hypothetical protein